MRNIFIKCFTIPVVVLMVMILSGCKSGGPGTDPGGEGSSSTSATFEWVLQAGGSLYDTAYAVAADSNNNLYITGFFEAAVMFGNTTLNTYGSEDYDIFIARCDSSGNFIWCKQAGSSDYDEGTGITTDNRDNIYVTGYFKGTAAFDNTTLTSMGDRDMFVGKFDSDGNLIWVKQAGSSGEDSGEEVKTDHADNVLVTGSFTGTAVFDGVSITSNGNSDIFTAKYDSSGNLLWVKQAGGTSHDRGLSVTGDNSDNVFITGYFKNTALFDGVSLTSNGDRDIFIAKYDNSGNVLWVRQAGGSYWDYGYSITTDTTNNAYVTGFFFENAVFAGQSLTSAGHNDVFIAKYDNSGNLLWVKQAGGSSYDRGKSIIADNSGNIYLTGHFKSDTAFENTSLNAHGEYDIFVAKYDTAGNFKWVKHGGGDDYDDGCGITLGSDGSIYITGSYSCYNGPAVFGDISWTGSEYFDIFIGKLVEK